MAPSATPVAAPFRKFFLPLSISLLYYYIDDTTTGCTKKGKHAPTGDLEIKL
jgi:hypothetical protein